MKHLTRRMHIGRRLRQYSTNTEALNGYAHPFYWFDVITTDTYNSLVKPEEIREDHLYRLIVNL